MNRLFACIVAVCIVACVPHEPDPRVLSSRLKLCSASDVAFNATISHGIDADSGILSTTDARVRISVDPYIDHPAATRQFAQRPSGEKIVAKISQDAKATLYGYDLPDGRLVFVLIEPLEGRNSRTFAAQIGQSLRVCR